LIPATGFFEWKELNLEGKAEKIPFYISMKDKRAFSFAGLYDVWKDVEGKEFYSYAILTTTPNEVMSPIHNRMPIILRFEDEDKYLDKETELDDIMKLLTPYKGVDLKAYPVSRLVNSPSNDEKDILEELK
jgi:putative SOS response-associated peptidase YedK